MKPGLSGIIPIADAIQMDYPIRECLESMRAVCDEIVVADWKSSDGTTEMLNEWTADDPKIKVVHYSPHEEPRGMPEYNLRWMNYARERVSHQMMLHMDADEILDDTAECHEAINRAVSDGLCRTFNRLNFWRDHKHLIPDGYHLGRCVTRMGPSNYWLPCDEPRHPGESRLRDDAELDASLRIFHVGFLRRPDAFYAKAKRLLMRKFARYDHRLEAAEAAGKPVWESETDFGDKLEEYTGSYPAILLDWLKQHGFEA